MKDPFSILPNCSTCMAKKVGDEHCAPVWGGREQEKKVLTQHKLTG